jgi:hypothetical protein
MKSYCASRNPEVKIGLETIVEKEVSPPVLSLIEKSGEPPMKRKSLRSGISFQTEPAHHGMQKNMG